ncbi:DNA helicase [Streptomyces phage Bmoc]|uniref:Uncharacterized protein n=1 Tax=Streptomyces phage Bmoc TaxID=2725629 RepID=A0A6M3SY35_9CAUD|nr:DNA helicase [Streptomyces phage Bmoc]QJD50913.1 hypothetical protein SEA_BMOC_200 [Streptomyces phage Bmoc]
MMCLAERPKSQVFVSPVKTGCTQTTPRMGEEAFKCMDCGQPYPNHELTCPWHPNNLK